MHMFTKKLNWKNNIEKRFGGENRKTNNWIKNWKKKRMGKKKDLEKKLGKKKRKLT